MSMEKGTVEQIGVKDVQGKYGPGKVYNLKIDGQWLGCGFKQPDVNEGDYIEFNVTMNGKYKNIDVDSVQKIEGEAPQKAPSVQQAVARGGAMNKDDYWSRREARDLETQKRIQLQSARNSAIAAVEVLVETGAVKLPAALNKRYDVMLALIDEVTAKYYNDTVELYVADGGDGVTEEVA